MVLNDKILIKNQDIMARWNVYFEEISYIEQATTENYKVEKVCSTDE